MNRYQIRGSVMCFGRCIGTVEKETYAVSEAKAKSNALYQVKKSMNLNSASKLTWGKDVVVLCY